MRQINAEKTEMQNGLRVITYTTDSEIFSMGVGIRVGSLYEDPENSGISHLIEHMLFKGTENRDADKLNNDIEKLAGDLDIYTTYNETVMSANIMKNRAKECLEIVSDMLMNAVFPEKELRLEKKVIIEEIKMAKDDPEDLSYTGLYKAAFPEVWHKYHIAGTIKSVKGIKANMLKEFYKTYYIPSNTVISIASSYSHEEIVGMIEQSFGAWEKEASKELDRIDSTFTPKKVISHKQGIGQAHILYGFNIKGLDRREEVALALLNKKIGASPNSLLFKELRDKKGYTYSVYSDIDFTDNIKMFCIYSAVSEENLKDTLSIIDDVINKFKSKEIVLDNEAINLIRDVFYTDISIGLETPSHVVEYLLDGELCYKNPIEYQKVLSMIDSITASDIERVIDKVLKDPIIHILSPK